MIELHEKISGGITAIDKALSDREFVGFWT